MIEGNNPSYDIIWDHSAKEDLRLIFEFNKSKFSSEFAQKINIEIYEVVGNIVFLKQWQKDEILGEPYRRIVVRHYKVIYRISDNKTIRILMVFDVRQDPSKYKLE